MPFDRTAVSLHLHISMSLFLLFRWNRVQSLNASVSLQREVSQNGKTGSKPNRRNSRAFSGLTARGGGLRKTN